MHLAVDGSIWGGQERGVAIATRRLWFAYLQRSPNPDVTVFASRSYEALFSNALVVPVGPLRGISRLAWQQFILPVQVHNRGIELLHCPCYTVPLAVSCRMIVTVHDLIAWTHPNLVGWRNALHLRLIVGLGVNRADAVCVPTEFVRKLVVDRFALPPAKVFVVPWGVDIEITPLARDEAVRQVNQEFDINEPFVLFCGCLEAKKNLETAIRASAKAHILLVIVGPWISGSARVLGINNSDADLRWRYLGYVSTSDLSALYSAATALVFPSYTEGFGLPAIEAMRCGCPVVASDAEAVREVCGGAALHVPHWDILELAATLRLVATDLTLHKELSARGLARAAHFNWANALDSFEEALNYAGRS